MTEILVSNEKSKFITLHSHNFLRVCADAIFFEFIKILVIYATKRTKKEFQNT